jgi:hypothetical protein
MGSMDKLRWIRSETSEAKAMTAAHVGMWAMLITIAMETKARAKATNSWGPIRPI